MNLVLNGIMLVVIRRDINAMEAGRMDPGGEGLVQSARHHATVGFAFSLFILAVGFVLTVVFWALRATSGR